VLAHAYINSGVLATMFGAWRGYNHIEEGLQHEKISSRLWLEQVWLRSAAVLLAAAVPALQVL
jgi:hypothetical protein